MLRTNIHFDETRHGPLMWMEVPHDDEQVGNGGSSRSGNNVPGSPQLVRGSMGGTFVGLRIAGPLNNGLSLLHVKPDLLQVVFGAQILEAVLIDRDRTGGSLSRLMRSASRDG